MRPATAKKEAEKAAAKKAKKAEENPWMAMKKADEGEAPKEEAKAVEAPKNEKKAQKPKNEAP